MSTLDTLSVLENKYAKSEAFVSGGVFTHSLETKPVREPVSVESKEIVRDSIVWRDRIQTKTVEVKKPMSLWTGVLLFLGGYVLLSLIVAIIYLYLTKKSTY